MRRQTRFPRKKMQSDNRETPRLAISPEAVSKGEPPNPEVDSSYQQIIKSSALIGSVSVINIAVSVIRTKVLAVLLGPSGFGLMSLYNSVLDLAYSVASMGVSSSGVRQIAEANAADEQHRVARTVTVVRRVALALAVIGAVLLGFAAYPISSLTFGRPGFAGGIALLSLGVFFRVTTDSNMALLQGLRRIRELAAVGLVGSASGAVLSIVLVYYFQERGVVPAIIGTTACTLVAAIWFSRRVALPSVRIGRNEFAKESAQLLRLGLAFMGSGFAVTAAAYAVRMIIAKGPGLEAAGLYQAAWTLGGLYAGVILQAMGADFYPRLVAVSASDTDCNRIVNEQVHASLLLGGPGILATVTFAPLIIATFYSAQFLGADEVLRWICVGIAMRLLTWPMGYIVVARNRQALFLSIDVAWAIVNVTLAFAFVRIWGVRGAGMAFLGAYVFHLILIYPIVRRMTGFRLSQASRRTGALLVVATGLIATGAWTLKPVPALVLGLSVTVVGGIYSVIILSQLAFQHRLPPRVLRILERTRLAR